MAVRRRPLKILASPWTERHFVLRRYEEMLEQLADSSRFNVVPLLEMRSASADRVVVGLRHDVDERLDNALELARLEYRHGLAATYFILHTARYYGTTRTGEARHDEALIARLRVLEQQGHEVGWHNDLVTLQCVYGIEPRSYLASELDWLRANGIDVRGCAKHGSYWCHALGFDNNYFFSDFDEVDPKFPNSEVIVVDGRRCEIAKARLGDFGLEYEAYHLGYDRYYSDARFDSSGRRWHTDALDLDGLQPGDRVVVSTHPDFWQRSVLVKATQMLERVTRRVLTGRRA